MEEIIKCISVESTTKITVVWKVYLCTGTTQPPRNSTVTVLPRADEDGEMTVFNR